MFEQFAALIAVVGGLYGCWRFIVRLYRAHKGETKKNEAYALVERFILFFNAHGISRTQIPLFVGEQYLTLSDISADEKLLHYVFTSAESAVAKDEEEAIEIRQLIKQSPWLQKSETATGPINKNIP